ncbi:hypothetical protein WDZ92_38105 [Nostoc sp. NIES-2111]
MDTLAHWTDGVAPRQKIFRPETVAARLRRLGEQFWQAWGQYRAARAMRGLSPEMLKDIGVPFAEIDTVVRQGRPQLRQGPKGGSRP